MVRITAPTFFERDAHEHHADQTSERRVRRGQLSTVGPLGDAACGAVSAARFGQTDGNRWTYPWRKQGARIVGGRQEDQLSTRRSILLVQVSAFASHRGDFPGECQNQT